jgi:hypothetical protein
MSPGPLGELISPVAYREFDPEEGLTLPARQGEGLGYTTEPIRCRNQ